STGSALESGGSPIPNGQQESTAQKNSMQGGKQSLDGIRERGLRSVFREDEWALTIQGFGNPAALMVVLRQLDLSEQQKQEIKEIRERVGDRLRLLQTEYRQLDLQLTDAIYGENFDPKRVEELAAQAAEKQGEIIKLRASIESQLRQA